MSSTNNYSDSNEPISYSSTMNHISTPSLTSTALESNCTIDGNAGLMIDSNSQQNKTLNNYPMYHATDQSSLSFFSTLSNNTEVNSNNKKRENGNSINKNDNENGNHDSTELMKSRFWTKTRTIIQRQIECNANRYALQMGVAFLVATLFVVVEPITKFAPNAFWVGVSVVTVLDNSVGGFLALSIQRMIGTFIGGGLSIFVMTISRAIFPIWGPGATVFLCFLMFCQVFTIARIKLRPNMNYAGGIGLLTTVIILLSGYPNLIHDKISGSAELGFWRVFDLIIGIFIAMWASLCIFPLKARNIMRKNLGEALEEAADLYERAAVYCLDLTNLDDVTKLPTSLDLERRKDEDGGFAESVNDNDNTYNGNSSGHAYKKEQNNINGEIIQGNRRVSVQMRKTCGDNTNTNKSQEEQESPVRQTTIQIEEPLQRTIPAMTLNNDMEIWNHELINELSDKAFRVLSRLQTEAMRLRSVSKEYYLQVPFHYILSGGRRERWRKYLQRTKQYSDSIDAMKRIVWPLVSFRLLLPLIKIDNPKRAEVAHIPSPIKLHNNTSSDNSATIATTATAIHDRVTPTKALLENFEDSLWVMRKLAAMLKNTKQKLSDESDWPVLQWYVMSGTSLVQQELLETINIVQSSDRVDGLKLLSYYGFLVRCSNIWQGLESIVNELGPQQQNRRWSVSTFSHVSYPPSSQATLHAQE